MIVGIIPAKSGSKRLKNKNTKILYNKPLIFWTIKYAKESKLMDKIYVSTNSKKIASMAKKYKVAVIKRPIKLCGETPIIDVYKHSYNKIKNQIKFIVGLQPDHPDRTNKLDDVIKIFKKKKADFLYSVDKKNNKNGAHYILSNKVLTGKKIKKKVKIVDNCTNIHFLKDLKKAEKNLRKNEK